MLTNLLAKNLQNNFPQLSLQNKQQQINKLELKLGMANPST
jgi:hypothetical protein